MTSSFSKIDITVNGERVHVDLNEELQIKDLSSDMSTVAAKMAIWGAIWAAAEAEQESVDAHYRRWRADLGQKLLAASDKAAEWKIKQEIEAAPDFIKYKEAAAKALQHAILARSIYESHKAMVTALQTAGANARAEMSATGMSVTTSPDPRAEERNRTEAVARGVSAMRDINKKKRAAKA